jgi:hypothetical protein
MHIDRNQLNDLQSRYHLIVENLHTADELDTDDPHWAEVAKESMQNIDQDVDQELASAGIDVHRLPSNVQQHVLDVVRAKVVSDRVAGVLDAWRSEH